MQERIKTYFNSLEELSDLEWSEMEKCFELFEFKKGQILLNEGKACEFIGFLNVGVIRFYQLKEGNEKVTAFWFPGDFLSNYRSFITGKPSEHYIESLTAGSFWKLKKEALLRLYDDFPKIDRLGRKMTEQLYLMVTFRLDNIFRETPEVRYQSLLKKNSKILHEVPQYMIASYLGVSAETLSRIRRRIRLK